MLDYSKSISDKVQIQNKEYVNIYLRSDSESNFYKKESYDFLQYLGDLGGLIDIVLLLGTFLTSFLLAPAAKVAELSMPKLSVSISRVSVEGLKPVILSMFLTVNLVGDEISMISSPLLEDSLVLLLISPVL